MTRTTHQDIFKNILFVYAPESLNILRCAARMAEGRQAHLSVIDVASDLDEYKGFLPPDITEGDLVSAISTERQKDIQDYLASAGPDLSGIEIRIRFGKAAIEIIRDVMAYDHDLVMKKAVGGSGLAARLFGSTALKLIRKCPCPVWIAHPESPVTPQRVLAAIDPMPTTDRSVRLNQQILRVAFQMAQMGGGRLDVLHSWHLPGESSMTFGRTKIPQDKFQRIRDMAEKVHRQKAFEFIEGMQMAPPSVNLHVLHGKPTETVLAFADREQSDLIVIGTTDQSSLAGLFLGSTAEGIIEKSRTSVLAIKPEGFISPIKPR